MAAGSAFLSTTGRPASKCARLGVNSRITSALAASARAFLAPIVFSSAADAPRTARRRSPLTCRRSATGLSDMVLLALNALSRRFQDQPADLAGMGDQRE